MHLACNTTNNGKLDKKQRGEIVSLHPVLIAWSFFFLVPSSIPLYCVIENSSESVSLSPKNISSPLIILSLLLLFLLLSAEKMCNFLIKKFTCLDLCACSYWIFCIFCFCFFSCLILGSGFCCFLLLFRCMLFVLLSFPLAFLSI